MTKTIREALGEAQKEIEVWDWENRLSPQRKEIAHSAKKMGIKITYTRCKELAMLYYGLGLLSFLTVRKNETVDDFVRRMA